MKPNYRLSMKHTDSAEREFCGGGGIIIKIII
jgi:hypothetical protein